MNVSWDSEVWTVTEYPGWSVGLLHGTPADHALGRNLSIEDFGTEPFCADEFAAFSSIFGAIVFDEEHLTYIDGFGSLLYEDSMETRCYEWGYCSQSMQGRCFTYFSFYHWSMDDYGLESEIADDEGSVVHNTAMENGSHPVTFGNLSRKSLQRLRKSPWLFARKFAADAHLPYYEEEILKLTKEERFLLLVEEKAIVKSYVEQDEGILEFAEGITGGDACKESFSGTGSKSSGGESATLHFMFLAGDDMHHSGAWEQFFAHAPPGKWRVWLHCQEPADCQRSSFYLRIPGVRLVPKAQSIYCNELVSASMQALRESLAVETIAPLDKFVIVGDTTLPTKTFSAVYQALSQDSASDFSTFPELEWLSTDMNGQYGQHRFVVLNRTDAATFLCAQKPLFDSKLWPDWHVRLDSGRSYVKAKSNSALLLTRSNSGEIEWGRAGEASPLASPGVVGHAMCGEAEGPAAGAAFFCVGVVASA
eukprot:CAMPEP_0171135776 /NCGR_PEP_ID=MMETSP0766_2-20121228/130336_1 /TAXON_ID=439317 /ORGANISM="Gambierdiscus australes, Strain CAWD 149" /LENGTH=477 /DNA_ID=CAMNT_0011599293 /DNA_START=16 /DNA_END=1450 /DNA_ORIENTATION=-